MAFSLSVKMVIAVALLTLLVLQQTYAYGNDDEAYKKYLEEHPGLEDAIAEADREQENIRIPSCPPEYMEHYKECKGSLKSCSDCLGDAERNCDRAARLALANGIRSSNGGTCSTCTSKFAKNCDKIASMCFGYQDCGGGDLHCINFKCEYDT